MSYKFKKLGYENIIASSSFELDVILCSVSVIPLHHRNLLINYMLNTTSIMLC